ncbi:hypothetical protein BZG05_14900 [Salinivibrio kushneri]|uniref:hypothetical protein n=1 Tax=Salinivibrio kushneri TaxID=1908198 RepID=UPI000988ED8B|nr:hypothetical protein [Salinivibrio kushneri]OOE32290.1 hypothetical protein BZG05_14900 [Salinivibrio kushneri]
MTHATLDQQKPVDNDQMPCYHAFNAFITSLAQNDVERSKADAVCDLIHDVEMDIITRVEEGHDKYGVYLKPFNGRCALTDTYQEILDACLYYTQHAMEQNDGAPDALLKPEHSKTIGLLAALAVEFREQLKKKWG